jgi:hypothetical protein
MPYTSKDAAHVESEIYFGYHFPSQNIEDYSGHNDELGSGPINFWIHEQLQM